MVGAAPRLARAMPNAALLVSKGTTAFCLSTNTLASDAAIVQAFFSSMGMCVCMPEDKMDAVTGIGGSGPAFVALVVEALADGAVAEGIPRNVAMQMAASVVAGTGELLLRKKVAHPALLKDMVCSPSGTSIAGVAALEGGRRAKRFH